MALFVSISGALIVLSALWLFVQPRRVGELAQLAQKPVWLYCAALIRFLLGSLLIAAAPFLSYGGPVAIVGWILVVAALLILVIPPPVIRRLLALAQMIPAWLGRLIALIVFVSGSFLLLAANS